MKQAFKAKVANILLMLIGLLVGIPILIASWIIENTDWKRG